MQFSVSYSELQLLAGLSSGKTCRFGKHQEDRLSACQNRIRRLNQRAQRNERLLRDLRDRVERLGEPHPRTEI